MKSSIATLQTFMQKKIVFLLLMLYCLAGFSPALCQEPAGLQQQFEEKISQIFGLPVSVKDYRIQYATAYLEDVQIGLPDSKNAPFASIKKMSATCDLMSLLGGKLVLNDINISSLRCSITRNKDGDFVSADFPVSKENAKMMSFADLPFLKFVGTDLHFEITDKQSDRVVSAKIPSVELKRTKEAEELTIKAKGTLQSQKNLARPFSELVSQFNVELLLSGQIAAPQVSGVANIKELQLQNPVFKQEVRIADGSFGLSENRITVKNLSGSWGNSKFTVSGDIKDFSALKMSLNYKIDPLAFGELTTAILDKEGITIDGKGTSSGTLSGPVASYQVNGNLNLPFCNINALLAQKSDSKYVFPFKRLKAAYRVAGDKLYVKNAQAGIFSGQISGNGSVSTSITPAKFEMNLTGSGLKVEEFLSENSTEKNAVSGPVNAVLYATGDTRGLTTWNGHGSFSMNNGRYSAPPVVTPVLTLVNLRQYANGDIQSGNGTFKLNNGVLKTQDLVFVTEAGKAYYRGLVGLDTSLDGKMNLMFSTEAIRSSAALQQISLNGKNASIPTRVKGTLLNPSFPGFSAQKLLELGLQRQGEKMLQDILNPGNDKTDNDKDNSESSKSPEKLILDGLKGIFRNKQKPAENKDKVETEPAKTQDEEQKPDRIEDELRKIFKF